MGQSYMNDRSSITKKEDKRYDTTIILPHNHSSMPQFNTTYTDMCNPLIQCLSWGSEVADRRRAVMAMRESTLAPDAIVPSWPETPVSPGIDAMNLAGGIVPAEPVVGAIEAAPPAALREQTAVHLDISDAPEKMSLVVSSGNAEQDRQEDSQSVEAARVGYSGRTEKMHKFLAKEFQSSKSSASNLSYEQMCKKQAGGDRGVIAGCFFE